MKGINRIQWCSVVLLVFSLTACKVKRPETVLPDAKMENVLYDYHIAKAMGEEVPYNESYKRVLYIESVFKKYGITQADFDSSMVWFARNPEVLTKIYEKVNVRLKAERDGINHLIALRDNKPKECCYRNDGRPEEPARRCSGSGCSRQSRRRTVRKG